MECKLVCEEKDTFEWRVLMEPYWNVNVRKSGVKPHIFSINGTILECKPIRPGGDATGEAPGINGTILECKHCWLPI